VNDKLIATEKEIQKSILDYLRFRRHLCKRNNSGFVFINNPNGKKRAINVGEAGWPDIEGILKPSGRYFGIEVKTQVGKLSESQLNMKQSILDAGGIYVLARTIDDVIAAGF